MSLYGVELLPDNVAACRERLFDIWSEAYARNCGEAAADFARSSVLFSTPIFFAATL